MSRDPQDSDAAYRVRTIQTGTDYRNEGHVSVTVSRPYNTLRAARGEATRIKGRWSKSAFWETTVTVERATGWETV